MQSSEHLARLVDWRDEITLVPYSGVQILDFGFQLDTLELKSARFVERVVGGDDAQEEWALLPLSGDEDRDQALMGEERADDDDYSVRSVAALEPFLSKWSPSDHSFQETRKLTSSTKSSDS